MVNVAQTPKDCAVNPLVTSWWQATNVAAPMDLTCSHCCAFPLQRLLDYIKPDFVHIMQSGEIIKTGDMSLVDQLEASGYAILEPAAAR